MRRVNRIQWTHLRVMGTLMAAVLVAACGSADKAPAEAAIKAAEAALASVRTDAAKLVPDQLRLLEDGLTSAKASFDKGDYTAALGSAKSVAAKAGDLASAVATKRAELTRTWTDVSAGVPKMAEAIQSRVDILSQSKKLPAGLDKDKLEGAKAGLASLKQSWADASAAYSAGNLTDAVTKARTAKDKAVETMTALNMQVPEAAKQ
jgi:hypothetical protein